jgi:hypothetical protein
VRFALAMLFLFFVAAIPASADQIYDVTGTVTLTGNNVCAGPCVETLDFSFQVTYQPECCGFFQQVVLGSTTTSTGPLAPFTLIASPTNYFAFFNSANDEIDVFGPGFDFQPPSVPFPNLVGAELYGCGSPGANTCVLDFVPPGSPTTGHVLDASLEYTVKAVPEPSTLALLIAGAAVLLFLGFRRTSTL